MNPVLPVITLGTALLIAVGAASAAPPPTDAQRGKQLFRTCAICHAVSASAPAKLGPHLQGIVGRKSGAVAGFRYSAALKAKPVTWTETNLDKWLTNARVMVPGTTMVAPGVANPADRKALIAYLKKPVP